MSEPSEAAREGERWGVGLAIAAGCTGEQITETAVRIERATVPRAEADALAEAVERWSRSSVDDEENARLEVEVCDALAAYREASGKGG